uniref:Pericentrin/AKAP-450 centrosomal targeting domain-containing protein n=1 Tax=Trichuris muris TaxID=70415 RepID=A0A5S6QXR7_TRIMR
MQAQTVWCPQWSLLTNSVMTEGPGYTVEVDESLFLKRKTNRGRTYPQQQVFRTVYRETRLYFLALVRDRSSQTTILLIKGHVRPGTTVISDECCRLIMECPSAEGSSSTPARTVDCLDSSVRTFGQESKSCDAPQEILRKAQLSYEELEQRFRESLSTEYKLRQKLNISYEERQSIAQKLLQLEEIHFSCTSERVELAQELKNLMHKKNESDRRVQYLSDDVLKLQETVKKQADFMDAIIKQKQALELREANADSVTLELNEIEERFAKQEKIFNEAKAWCFEQLAAKDESMHNLKRECEESVAKEQHARMTVQLELDEVKRQLSDTLEAKDQLEIVVNTVTKKLSVAESERRASEKQWQEKHENLLMITATNEETMRDYAKAYAELEASLKEAKSSMLHITQVADEKNRELEELRAQAEVALNEKHNRIAELENVIKQLKRNAHSRAAQARNLEVPLSDYSITVSADTSMSDLRESYFDVVKELKLVESERDIIQQHCARFVKEVEERLPYVQALKEDKDDLTNAVETLRKKVECAEAETSFLNSQNIRLSNELAEVREERNQLSRSCSDLSHQVKMLLVTVEGLRNNSAGMGDVQPATNEENDIVSFRNVEEMQLRNQQLLSKLREASVERDKLVKEATEKECHDIRVYGEIVSKKLESRLAICSKLTVLVKDAVAQRDVYKQLYQDVMFQYKKLRNRLNSCGPPINVAELRKEMVSQMKKVTGIVDRHQSEVSRLQADIVNLETSRAECAGKLKLQEEMIKQSEAITDVLGKRAAAAEEDRDSLAHSVKELREALEVARSSLVEQEKTASEMKTENNMLKKQLEALERSNSQLELEIDATRTHSYKMDKLAVMIGEFKASTEIDQISKVLKSVGDWDALTKERDSLLASASLLQQDVEKLKAEKATEVDSLNTKLDEQTRAVEHLTRQLNFQVELNGSLEDAVRRREEECSALKAWVTNGKGGNADGMDLLLELSIAEARYKQCSEELASTKQCLESTQADLDDCKMLNESLGAKVRNVEKSHQQERVRWDTEMTELRSSARRSAAEIQELGTAIERERRMAEDRIAQYKNAEEQGRRELARLRSELDAKSALLDAESGELATLKRTIMSLQKELAEVRTLLVERDRHVESLRMELAAKDEDAASALDNDIPWSCRLSVLNVENHLSHAVGRLRNVAAANLAIESDPTWDGASSTTHGEFKGNEPSSVGSSEAVRPASKENCVKKLIAQVCLDLALCQEELANMFRQLEVPERHLRATAREAALSTLQEATFKISAEEFALVQLDAGVQSVIGGLDVMELRRKLYESSVTIDNLQAMARRLADVGIDSNLETDVVCHSCSRSLETDLDVQANIDELKKERDSLELSIEELTSRLESLASMYSTREARLKALKEEENALAAARAANDQRSVTVAAVVAKETHEVSTETSQSSTMKSLFKGITAQSGAMPDDYSLQNPASVSSTDQSFNNHGCVTSSVVSRSSESRESTPPLPANSSNSKPDFVSDSCDNAGEPTSSSSALESAIVGNEATPTTRRRRSISPSSSDNVKRFRAESPVQVTTTDGDQPASFEQMVMDSGMQPRAQSPNVGSSVICDESIDPSHSNVDEVEGSEQSASAKGEADVVASNDGEESAECSTVRWGTGEPSSCETDDIATSFPDIDETTSGVQEHPSASRTSDSEMNIAEVQMDQSSLNKGDLSLRQYDYAGSQGRGGRKPIVWDLGDNSEVHQLVDLVGHIKLAWRSRWSLPSSHRSYVMGHRHGVLLSHGLLSDVRAESVLSTDNVGSLLDQLDT